MAKRGNKGQHMKRIAVPKAVPVHDKKKDKWIIVPSPGPHSKEFSIPLGVLIRDVLGFAKTKKEVKMILSQRLVKVDGRTRTKMDFPVGFMDIVSFDRLDKHYRIQLDSKGRLVPVEIKKEEASKKIGRVVRKYTMKKGKIGITLHDGTTLIADNQLKVGDSVILQIPDNKIQSVLKLDSGVRCYVTQGKHAGSIVILNEIIPRKGRPNEARVSKDKKEFITVASYLTVIDDSIRGVSDGKGQ